MVGTLLSLNEGETVEFDLKGLVTADPRGGDVTCSLVGGATSGVTATGSSVEIDPDNCILTYIHNDGETVMDAVTYEIEDALARTASAEINFSITPVNDPPQANDDGGSVREGETIQVDVLENDEDPDSVLDSDAEGFSASVSITVPPIRGTATVLPDGRVEYTAFADACSRAPAIPPPCSDILTYQVNDGDSAINSTDTAQLKIDITAIPNTPPQLTAPAGDSIDYDFGLGHVEVVATDEEDSVDELEFSVESQEDHSRYPNDGSYFVIENNDGAVRLLFVIPPEPFRRYYIKLVVTDTEGDSDSKNLEVFVPALATIDVDSSIVDESGTIPGSERSIRVAENPSQACFTVTFDPGRINSATASVNFKTGGGADTAIAGEDYVAVLSGELRDVIDERRSCVTIINDRVHESDDETFSVIFELPEASPYVFSNGDKAVSEIFTIVDDDEPNTAPVINTPSTVDFAENSEEVVLDIQSTDDYDREGSGLDYRISGGADQALFGIDAGTGELTFDSAPDFELPADAGGDNVYEVEVTVADSEPLETTQLISVEVTDVVENTAPVITSPDTVSFAENDDGTVLNIESMDDSDSEGSGLDYRISGGADQALFGIDAGTGELTFDSAPDFELPADAGANNVYEVEVTVADSQPLEDTQLISVEVTDVDEGAASTITVSIDPDPPVINEGDGVVLARNSIRVDSSGSGEVCFSVESSAAEDVIVGYETEDGSATTAGFDYLSTSGELVIDNGQTPPSECVQILDDPIDEDDETFLINFTIQEGDAEFADGSASSSVAITIQDNDPNQPPIAEDDSFTLGRDGEGKYVPVVGDVGEDNGAGEDSDPDGHPLSFSLDSNVTGGILTLNLDGSFVYTPDVGTTDDSFTYIVDDGRGGTDIGTVIISDESGSGSGS